MNDQQNLFVPKNAAYFRAKARAALRGHWGLAILALLIAGICGAFETSFSSGFDSEKTLGIRVDDVTNPEFFTPDYWQSILARIQPEFFALLLSGAVFAILFSIAWQLFVGAPVRLGYEKFNLSLIDGATPTVGTLFDGFRMGYIKSVSVRVLLFLIKLAYCLPLIIASVVTAIFSFPLINAYAENSIESLTNMQLLAFTISSLVTGAVAVFTVVMLIVVELRYSCAYMILAEYPDLPAADVLRKSTSLMHGNKWRLFCLNLSFIGWFLLSTLFTCAIGLLWTIPYCCVANTAFYDEIANRRAAHEAEFPSLDPDDYAGSAPTDFQ